MALDRVHTSAEAESKSPHLYSLIYISHLNYLNFSLRALHTWENERCHNKGIILKNVRKAIPGSFPLSRSTLKVNVIFSKFQENTSSIFCINLLTDQPINREGENIITLADLSSWIMFIKRQNIVNIFKL